MFNPDFKDMLSGLSAGKIDFLVVGAYAMAAHGHPRATGDLDIWVRADHTTALELLRVLAEFGAPLQDLTVDDLSQPDVVFQIGVEPSRIDILTSVSGVSFDSAWQNRMTVEMEGLVCPVIGRDDLIANKRACGRPKDIADIVTLVDPDAPQR